jgi:Spy/CpxP family protein refolding chaperone
MDVVNRFSQGVSSMRTFFSSVALGSLLAVGLSGNALLAQDQSAPPAASAPSPAQRPAHVPNPRHQAKKMAKALSLTPDQVSKIEPILADRDQQVQSLRSDTTLAPNDRKAKMRSIRQDSDSRIEALLTDTQKQQYEQIKQSRKANRHQQATAPATS